MISPNCKAFITYHAPEEYYEYKDAYYIGTSSIF